MIVYILNLGLLYDNDVYGFHIYKKFIEYGRKNNFVYNGTGIFKIGSKIKY